MTAFRGHDYTELLDVLGISGGDETDGGLIQGRQELFSWPEVGSEEDKQRIKLMRDFLSALIEEEERIGYRAPLFKGLAQLEDPATFVKYFGVLLPHMWM